jgi:hypothetical protein
VTSNLKDDTNKLKDQPFNPPKWTQKLIADAYKLKDGALHLKDDPF